MTPKLTTSQRAALLAAPAPGRVVEVPLDLWPAYKELHKIEAVARGAARSPDLVWVKRVEPQE